MRTEKSGKMRRASEHQQANSDDGQRYDAMPSFPPPETTEETILQQLGTERVAEESGEADPTSNETVE